MQGYIIADYTAIRNNWILYFDGTQFVKGYENVKFFDSRSEANYALNDIIEGDKVMGTYDLKVIRIKTFSGDNGKTIVFF